MTTQAEERARIAEDAAAAAAEKTEAALEDARVATARLEEARAVAASARAAAERSEAARAAAAERAGAAEANARAASDEAAKLARQLSEAGKAKVEAETKAAVAPRELGEAEKVPAMTTSESTDTNALKQHSADSERSPESELDSADSGSEQVIDKAEAAALKDEYHALSEQVRILVAEKQELEGQLDAIADRVEERQRVADAQAEVDEVRSLYVRVTSELEVTRSELEQSKLALKSAEAELVEARESEEEAAAAARLASASRAATMSETGPIVDLEVDGPRGPVPGWSHDAVQLVSRAVNQLAELDTRHAELMRAINAMKRKLQARDDRDLNALDRWQLISAMNALIDPVRRPMLLGDAARGVRGGASCSCRTSTDAPSLACTTRTITHRPLARAAVRRISEEASGAARRVAQWALVLAPPAAPRARVRVRDSDETEADASMTSKSVVSRLWKPCIVVLCTKMIFSLVDESRPHALFLLRWPLLLLRRRLAFGRGPLHRRVPASAWCLTHGKS